MGHPMSSEPIRHKDPLKGLSPRQAWSLGGRAAILRVCQRYPTAEAVGRVVGAKPATVRRRMRRYGVMKWPVQRTRVKYGANPAGRQSRKQVSR